MGDQVILTEDPKEGLMLHRKTCPKAAYAQAKGSRTFRNAFWVIDNDLQFSVPIQVRATQERVAIRDVTHAISLREGYLEDMNVAGETSGEIVLNMKIRVKNRTQLLHVLRDVRALPFVKSAQRNYR